MSDYPIQTCLSCDGPRTLEDEDSVYCTECRQQIEDALGYCLRKVQKEKGGKK